MSKIKEITAREIKDSRGKPTVEVFLRTEKGEYTASVPSGASTGKNEALELRDEDGKGVLRAIKNVNEIIAPKMRGKDAVNQKDIDGLMIALDGTEKKSKLGANAILGVSMAVCRAGAGAKKLPLYRYISECARSDLAQNVRGQTSLKLPLAMFNILNGGVHAKNNLDIQEFMIIPQKKTFAENLVLCNKAFQILRDNIGKNFGEEHLELGDEGGFAPPISSIEQALYLLKSAIGLEDANIALDCAASEFFKNGKYHIEGKELTRSELAEFYQQLINGFPIVSIEDPFSEDDWQGWQIISNFKFQISNFMIIGDDLTATNAKKIREAHNKSACNGVILKLNQVGTVSETIEAANLAKSFGWKTVVSHRSGETMDNFIADLAVGIGADFLKAGSPAKPERMVKYNRLLEIENELALRK